VSRVTRPTLRELAGLPAQPVLLADSTLVLIDCQHTYTQGVMELDGVQVALDEAAALLDRCDRPPCRASRGRAGRYPGVGDTAVSASAMQLASLAAMADLFAVVVPDTGPIPG
jgi:hypothetical protein